MYIYITYKQLNRMELINTTRILIFSVKMFDSSCNDNLPSLLPGDGRAVRGCGNV